MREDWKKKVVYQIYPKSFKSTSGKSTGDLRGIIEKLDYLADLGVDLIWLNPIYRSPQNDNGYDISDYYQIDERYGTMADFEELIVEAKKRNIGVMMDIVVNHTSTEHPWFQESKKSKDNPYRSFYIWRDKPNNWQSKFGGSAWEYDETTGQYYLHLFDKTQADLNWENPQVRKEVYNIINFWVEKGVAGFRLDVINLISKDPNFPDDHGEGTTGDGRVFYTDGPRVHEYLKEMHREVFAGRNLVTVGEMSSTSIDHCIRYSNPEEKELSMTFSFHHLKVDYPGGEKWIKADFDFLQLKKIMTDWQVKMHEGGGWNALFWCNHDQPRVVSRFGNDKKFRVESAKMLATALHMLQGTPYIYQGEEIGMTNPGFDRIEDYRDVETINIYRLKREEGVDHQQIMEAIQQKSRDNSRTPMQWDDSPNAGFSTANPWIPVAPNYREINVKNDLSNPHSIWHYYKKLIHLRKTVDVITDGSYHLLLEDHPRIWAYLRQTEKEVLLVVNNFYGEETEFVLPEGWNWEGWKSEILISNYADSPLDYKQIQLRPYESIVYRFSK